MFDDFLIRLAGLTKDQKPLWGKMTPQHMVEHLIWIVQRMKNLTEAKEKLGEEILGL